MENPSLSEVKKYFKDAAVIESVYNTNGFRFINKHIVMSNTERFYEWLKMCGNIYLHDNEKIQRAFHIVALNS